MARTKTKNSKAQKNVKKSTTKKNRAKLIAYHNHLDGNTKCFPCPFCHDLITSSNFEYHCDLLHTLNRKTCCVWCLGQYTWPGKQKHLHIDHLVTCWRKFVNQTAPPLPSIDMTHAPAPKPFDMTPMYPPQNLFDRVFDPPPRAYDLVWPMALDPNPLTFENASLDRAVSCMRKYLALRHEADWFHVMVRKVAYLNFLEAMDRDEGKSRTLIFSCWCDGGEPTEDRLRQHRHFIVIAPKGHFLKNVWNRMERPEDLPRRNFLVKHCDVIEGPIHFANLLGYVSKRESTCNFEKKETQKERLNHFYLFQELPKDFLLPLVLQWNNGLIDLLTQTFKNMSKRTLVESAVYFFGNKWRFHIKDIPGITLSTVLPVSREFQPCLYETDFFVHLIGGRKLFFQRNPSLSQLSHEDWLRKQADLGNMFLYVVAEEQWTPRPFHQSLINAFKPIVDRNRELETENQSLKRKHEDQNEKIEQLEAENRGLKRKHEAQDEKMDELHHENRKLHHKIHDLNEGEIKRLKQKIQKLEQENESYKSLQTHV